ncbi:MAG: hypothetical protein K2L90_04870 [Muribaculaceae bacterium]|nr:hypothetical protein [Muribaculaceae bacterium]
MKPVSILLMGLLSMILWSCDDGKQLYTQLKVDSEYYDISKPMLSEEEIAECGFQDGETHTLPYGLNGRVGEFLVWRLNKGTVFTVYTDADWKANENLFIIDGNVVAENIITPWDEHNVVDENLSIVKQGNFEDEKGGLSLGEYQDLLNETCPPKAQARRHFLWVTIILAVFLVVCCLAIGVFPEDKKEAAKKNDIGAIGWSLTIGMLILFLLAYIAPMAYFYYNPRESMWIITDWGFLGFFVGCGIVYTTLALACWPAYMLGTCFKQIFSREWRNGLLLLIALIVFGILSYFLIEMVLVQIWDQCGFIIRSIGVVLLLVLLPTGLSTGLKRSSDPDMVSDGNGNNLFVSSSQNGGSTIQTTDGDTMYRRSDGNYNKLN